MIRRESGVLNVVEELGERVVASSSEAGDDPPIRAQVYSKVREYWSACAGVEERQDVAGTDNRIERLLDAHRWEVEFGEVGDDPRRGGCSCLAASMRIGSMSTLTTSWPPRAR